MVDKIFFHYAAPFDIRIDFLVVEKGTRKVSKILMYLQVLQKFDSLTSVSVKQMCAKIKQKNTTTLSKLGEHHATSGLQRKYVNNNIIVSP